MDSDGSHDSSSSSSSDSENETQNNEPRSPESGSESRNNSPSPTNSESRHRQSRSPKSPENRSNSALSSNSFEMQSSPVERTSRNTIRSSEKHSPDRESIKSRSPSGEIKSRSQSREIKSRSQSREFKSRSQSRDIKSRSQSREIKSRSQSREIKSRSQSREIKSRSQSRELKSRSQSRDMKSRSQSQNSKSRSQSRESNDSNRSRSRSNSNKSPRNRSPSSDRESAASGDSNKSKSSSSRKSDGEDDGNSSDSSASSRGSKRHKSFSSNVSAPVDTQPEEISDGEMELDAPKDSEDEEPDDEKKADNNIQISHEDLSDVSDLDSVGGDRSDEDKVEEKEPEAIIEEPVVEPTKSPPTDLRLKLDEAAKQRKIPEPPKLPEKTSKTEDCEEALDFEAEDGECLDDSKEENGELGENGDNEEVQVIVEKKPPEDLEEGEVTDDDETRPEETEPRPVCRFYSRGQCTWGASCRFLHPGVTDKGNYTMFEMIRPVVPGPALVPGFGAADFRDERVFGHPALVRPEPPPAESAWERGLRTAKEMVRRAIKRKEQDMDFEEKKMNLTLSQDELDKENGYYARAASPVVVEPVVVPPPVKHYVRHDPYYPPPQRHPEEYYRRVHHYEPAAPPVVAPVRQVRIEPEYEAAPPPARERVHSYRELPTHRMPDYYNDKYEERTVTMSAAHKRPHRSKREVIVQRVDAPAPGRGDEWADPWMRSKSPGARGGRSGPRRQSYSSGSSYSSSSSTRSSSASSRSTAYRRRHRSRSRSRSGSATRNRRRAAVTSPAAPQSYRREGGRRRGGRGAVSPSVIVSERKAAHERASLMNPPAPSARKPHKDTRPPSPGMMRTSSQNPPAPVKVPGTDQFGRTTKREVDRITSERRNLDPDRKKLVVAAIAAKVKGQHAVRSPKSSSGSDSSGSSSSDSESSYSSSSSSREEPGVKRKIPDSRMELAAIALKAKAMDSLKGERGLAETASKKRPATSPPTGDPPAKVGPAGKSSNTTAGGGSSNSGSSGGKKATSRREELLKQLKAVEDAIAKKRSKIN